MKKVIAILIIIVFVHFKNEGTLFAQQDPQYSQYMFNQMAINPAYAGSKEALVATTFFRTQWTGIDGAPKTESLTLHGPLRKKKAGLALAIIADQIGPKKSIGVMGSYAYRIKLGKGKLSFGLRAGVYNYVYNWDDITYKDQADIYNTHTRTSILVPNADAGLYYYTTTFYSGFSATHLYNGRIETTNSIKSGDNSPLSPHFFFTVSKAWEVSDNLVFNPTLVVKSVQNAPSSFDVNLSFLFDNKLWLGASYRYGYGMVAYAQFHVTEKFKIGYSFDFAFNKIALVGGGSHEIMLSYEFGIYKSKMFSPRYL